MRDNGVDDQISELIDLLTILILDHPDGCSEYELLTLLQQPPYEFFDKNAMNDPLKLFQTHFLLFHCLYTLRAQWLDSKQALLSISALKIVRSPLKNKDFTLSTSHSSSQSSSHINKQSNNPISCENSHPVLDDPLAEYYLDISHLSNTERSDVEALLDSFWTGMKTANPRFDSKESLSEAMAILELKAPVEVKDLKGQYRRLAQRYHPDKGGDSEHFKKICRAYHQLSLIHI